MEIIGVIKSACSFLGRVGPYVLAGLVYLMGRRSAKKDDQVREQKKALQDQEKVNRTLQAMDTATVKAPSDKTGLVDSLNKGGF